MVSLFSYQKEAIEKIHSGCILSASVGTGKSITALAYYYIKECKGALGVDGQLSAPKEPKDLYIITTARKRDTLEWNEECNRFDIRSEINSWNNIHKYKEVTNSFFIFDEQRLVGAGAWVKSFLKICKRNRWILLSATPGDTWTDYIPVFVANGFYKNRTEFLSMHAVYNQYCKFPKIDRFVDVGRLESYRRQITVLMECERKTVHHRITLLASYDLKLYKRVSVDRWDPYLNKPIQEIAGACYLMRKVANSDPSRLTIIRELMVKHPRIIIFYNYDFELELLRTLNASIEVKEWNGHKHEPVPSTDRWLYLVQYMAGAEAWNCISTDTIVFFSQNYSYKLMTQAAGRIDRLNTPYKDLYYYHICSSASIDVAIANSLKNKKNFNEKAFITKFTSRQKHAL